MSPNMKLIVLVVLAVCFSPCVLWVGVKAVEAGAPEWMASVGVSISMIAYAWASAIVGEKWGAL